MTDEHASKPQPTVSHAFLLWAKKWATHPTVVLTARVALAAIALAVTSVGTYVVSIDSKASAIGVSLDKTIVTTALQFDLVDKSFEVVGAQIEAQSEGLEISREDRLRFQNEAIAALNKLIDGQAATLANIAAQNERMKSIEDRLTRSDN